MKQSLALLSVTTLLAATAGAQCFTVSGTSITSQMTATGAQPVDDEGTSADIALGFSFGIGGASYSHVVIGSNGDAYFTDGTGATNVPVGGIDSLADLRGGAGGSPRVTPFSGDLAGVPGSWDILVDTSVNGEFKITWTGMRYASGTGNFAMSLRMNSQNRFWFDYAGGDFGIPDTTNFAGASGGDDAGSATTPASDINTVTLSTVPLIYQNTWPPFDLPGSSLRFVGLATGGFVVSQACGGSMHETFGESCGPTESFYQWFTDAAVASSTLTGNGILLTPTAGGYDVAWIPQIASSLYVPPTAAATNLPVLNDGEVIYPLQTPLMTPFGTSTDLTVSGNGIIAFGVGPIEAGFENWVADPALFAAASHGGVYCWHPYNEEEGGDVWAEESNGIAYITFEDVENWPATILNPSTFQIQFNKTSGEIWMLFVQIDPDNSIILGTWGQDHLIGYTPPGASLPTLGLDLPTDLPISLQPELPEFTLTASPGLTSTTSAGSTATYSIGNAPEVVPGSGTAVGLMVFSTSSVPGGLDLGVLGAPGCFSYVGGLDTTFSFVGPPGPQDVPLTIPAGVPPGLVIYAQAVSLLDGFNTFGIITSNGIKSTVGSN